MGVPSKHKWLLSLLYLSSLATTAEISSGSDPPLTVVRNNAQAGRSPPEIPLLQHDIATPKFRNTNTNQEDVERYQALAPASQSAVRAPSVQSAESQSLSPLGQARLLSEWEADDLILLSTVDGALHARDRRSSRKRWILEIPDSPMIQAIYPGRNRTSTDEMLIEDDEYMFVVEPSMEGQLYALFADPQHGLLKLGTTVRKMATEVPSFMAFKDQFLITTSSHDTKAYTIDAQTGEILNEFPRSKSSIQPRCRPRSGLDFEDSSCEPGRTLRLGRDTWTFTISNEQTHQDIEIRFSEWVPNKLDRDLQAQHTSSLDGYDVRTFYNGEVIGIDTSAEPDGQHKYHYTLDCPVARVFDVARKQNSDDDSTELMLLSRTTEYALTGEKQLFEQDPNAQQRVFINKTENGDWFAMSEATYPGVTSRALLAPAQRRKQNQFWTPLNLHGELNEIVGVHLLSPAQVQIDPQTKQRLTLPAPEPVTDMIVEPEKHLLDTDTLSKNGKESRTERIWTVLCTLAAVALITFCSRYLPAKIPLKLRLLGFDGTVQVGDFKEPVAVTEHPRGTRSAILGSDVQPKAPQVTTPTGIATPAHSRMQSLASSIGSPTYELKTAVQGQDDASDNGDSDGEDNENQDPEANGQNSLEDKKRKKTKRGVRGGRKNKKKGDPATFEPKPIISTEKHLRDGMVQVGRLSYDSKLESCLGQGSSGTAVFPGTFDGRCVAVKRLIKTSNSLAEKEIRHLVSSDEHPNVIRYHGKEESLSFFYIALDRFDTSLDQFVEFYHKFPTLVSPTRGYDVKDALRQIARGVQHLHALKLVHRDIKPQNILVRPVKTNRPLPEGQLQPLLFVISDFGLCKPLEDGPDSVFAATRTAAGTTGWKAPELLVSSRDAIAAPTVSPTEVSSQSRSHSQSFSKSTNTSSEGFIAIDAPTGRRATKAIDIFSLGCVFFYVMTRGGHPFDKGGSPLARDLNIKEDKYDTSLLRDSFIGYEYDADDLIMQMIMHNPKYRPDTSKVLQHPYFWKVEHKLDFICAVSDAYEERKQKITNIHDESAPRTDIEKEYLTELAALQAKAPDVIGLRKDGTLQDFLASLPKSFLNEMGKQRKYTGTKMIDLLRVIRNKKNHFHDLPKDVKEMMLKGTSLGTGNGTGEPKGQTEGYYSFWRDRFPSLLVNCHVLLLERGLVEEFGLERYYNGDLL